jgi:hypothetical protein
MYRLTLTEAIRCAKDFIKKADLCLQDDAPRIRRSKASGAMIRASMELTRRLADLRNNR